MINCASHRSRLDQRPFVSSSGFYKHMMDHMKDPIYVVCPDDDFRFHYVNAAACQHYNLPEEKILSLSVPDLDPIFTLERCRAHWDELKIKQNLSFETHHKINGAIVPVLVTSSALSFEGVEYSIGFIQNISDRKKTEAKLQVVTSDLEKALDFRDRIIGVLGHDLRNPLGAISGFSQLLKQEESLSPEAHEFADRIERGAIRMTEMTERLLTFARMRFGSEMPVAFKFSDLQQIFSDIIEEFRLTGREIKFVCHEELTGEWDSGRIGQIISNLISNAINHGDPERAIEVNLRSKNDHVIFSVHNWGNVISKDMISDIFEPFRRGNGGMKSSTGLGLGLFIVRKLVESHSGSIAVESSSENGTIFTVKIPRTQKMIHLSKCQMNG